MNCIAKGSSIVCVCVCVYVHVFLHLCWAKKMSQSTKKTFSLQYQTTLGITQHLNLDTKYAHACLP